MSAVPLVSVKVFAAMQNLRQPEERQPDITIVPPGRDDPWWTERRDGERIASA